MSSDAKVSKTQLSPPRMYRHSIISNVMSGFHTGFSVRGGGCAGN